MNVSAHASHSRTVPRVTVLGAGVAGLTAAFVLARRGATVDVMERRRDPGRGCSWYAGGMIAPWCEADGADALVTLMGEEALAFWTTDVPVATRAGSMVVAPARDLPDLRRFARRTTRHRVIQDAELASLEPDLAERFATALFFPDEAHLEPRHAIATLHAALAKMPNVTLHFGAEDNVDADPRADWIIDARGLAARDRLLDLRGVKGEMVVLRTTELTLARPVRLIHPRWPVYIVPRPGGLFMVGATMIETEDASRISARSLLELLGAAYALHPAFGEAEVVETGCDLRPAFPDNVPRVVQQGRRIHINGLFRHGFLLAPALARQAADIVFAGKVGHDDEPAHQRHVFAG